MKRMERKWRRNKKIWTFWIHYLTSTLNWSRKLNSNRQVGVNQQPPVHQFRMRLFKLFWGWTQTHPARPDPPAFLFSSSAAQGFFSPLICPKVFPSYLPP
jgi:hypothetical protein